MLSQCIDLKKKYEVSNQLVCKAKGWGVSQINSESKEMCVN